MTKINPVFVREHRLWPSVRLIVATAIAVSLPWTVAYERQQLATAAALTATAPPVAEVMIKYRNGVVARVSVRSEE